MRLWRVWEEKLAAPSLLQAGGAAEGSPVPDLEESLDRLPKRELASFLRRFQVACQSLKISVGEHFVQ